MIADLLMYGAILCAALAVFFLDINNSRSGELYDGPTYDDLPAIFGILSIGLIIWFALLVL